MSPRNGIVLLLAISALLFLAACGGSGSSVAKPVPPPSGTFSNSNLNGTFVFSISGTDSTGAPYAMAGTLTADGSGGNGKGNITAGTFDLVDINTSELSAPLTGASVASGSTYSVGVDGRGQAIVNTNVTNLTITFDFVLSDSSHGLISEFDGFGTGSGTLDLQSSGVTPSGSYAFLFSGATYGSAPFAAAGNFTLGTGGVISAGLADFNNGAVTVSTSEALGGTVVVAATPSTTLSTTQYPSLTFDVFPIDATHLKFIETDGLSGTLSGDAFAQTTGATVPTGTLAFTLQGLLAASNEPVAAGGFMVTDGNGNITNASSEDYNVNGTLSPSTPVAFSASYVPGGNGRYTLGTFVGFSPSNSNLSFAAYPSSGGLLLLEIDTNGLISGAAFQQTAGATFAAAQSYGMNLSGTNLSGVGAGFVEVDDIAQLTAASGGTISSGIIDENFEPGGGPAFGIAFGSGGIYGAIGTTGRYGIGDSVGNSTTSTLLGGFNLTFYTVDGTTFPFIESDSGQISTGVIVLQNPAASGSAAIAHSNHYVSQPLFRPHPALHQLQKK